MSKQAMASDRREYPVSVDKIINDRIASMSPDERAEYDRELAAAQKEIVDEERSFEEARKRIAVKSDVEVLHLERTNDGTPTTRSFHAQLTFDRARDFCRDVTGVRVNPEAHPMLCRLLRHEAGSWLRTLHGIQHRQQPDTEHRKHAAALLRFLSDEERSLHEDMHLSAWKQR